MGPSFDTLVDIDLLQPTQTLELWQYLTHCQPICGIMAPPCTGFGGFSALNRLMATRQHQYHLGNLLAK
eukprot:8321989-Prorocentrum_lima.AAC.1